MEIFWFAFTIVVGVAANARGRDGLGWFFLALIVSPLIALPLVLVMQNRRSENASDGPIILDERESNYIGAKRNTLVDDILRQERHERRPTLRLDWTPETTKLHMAMVMAAIGKSKETIYANSIRYLKFSNDVGGYNIIDWRTGENSSVGERAPYYFRG